MKKICLLLSCTLIVLFTSAQNFTQYSNVEFKKAEECKAYDSIALQCADYILTTPVDAGGDRLVAMQLLIKWMTATPDYHFNIDGSVAKYGSKDDLILAVYLAALTKFAFENKQAAPDENAVKLNAYHAMAVYCANKDNNVKLDKDLKKLIDADKKGTLNEYLR